MLFNKEDSPAHIVTIFPQASDLFTEYNINFCCDGEHPLERQCLEQGVNVETLLDELNERYAIWKRHGYTTTDWEEVPLSQIVEQIIEYHHYFKQELVNLERFVLRVNDVHGHTQPHLQRLEKLYETFKTALEAHIELEESELFPAVKQLTSSRTESVEIKIKELNKRLTTHHQTLIEMYNKIKKVTHNFEASLQACATYHVMYDRLADLYIDVLQYIHLEHGIFFKKVMN